MGLSNFNIGIDMLHGIYYSWVEMVFHLSFFSRIEPLYTQRAHTYKGINVPRTKIPHSNLCLFHFQSLFTFCHSTHFQPLVFGEKTCRTFYFDIDRSIEWCGKNVELFFNYYNIYTVNFPTCNACVCVVQRMKNQPHEVVHICVTCITTIVVNTLVYIVQIDI